MPETLVIDVANVVGSRPDGWWRDRPGATHRLRDEIVAADLGADIVLVIEGAARQGLPAGTEGRVCIGHAVGTGDDAILALLTSMPATTVVTSDRGLRTRVEAGVAAVAGNQAATTRWPTTSSPTAREFRSWCRASGRWCICTRRKRRRDHRDARAPGALPWRRTDGTIEATAAVSRRTLAWRSGTRRLSVKRDACSSACISVYTQAMATTVRVKEATRRRAASMAQNDGVTIGEIVDRALDAYESQTFWEQTRLALAARDDEPDPAWDVADRDGLET